MKCPYCQKEMRFGHISASNVLAWSPDGESAFGFTRWARSENSVLLGKWYGLVDASVDAYLCDDCRKVIIDVPKPKEKKGKQI